MQTFRQKAYCFWKVSFFLLFNNYLRVVGGLETLNKIEMLETDKDDRPLVSD